MLQRLGIVLVAFALPAAAGAVEIYAGFGLGGKVAEGGLAEPVANLGPRAEDDSVKIYLGAGLGRYLGVEATYYDFGARSCCVGLADAGYDASLDGYSLTAIGRLPREHFELFAKAGVLAWDESGTGISLAGPFPVAADGEDLIVGAGVSLRLLEQLAVRAEWERYELGGDSADAVWLAAEIRF